MDVNKLKSMDEIYNIFCEKFKQEVLKWFISLFPISNPVLNRLDKESRVDLLITADHNLREILGESMFDRISNVKEEYLS